MFFDQGMKQLVLWYDRIRRYIRQSRVWIRYKLVIPEGQVTTFWWERISRWNAQQFYEKYFGKKCFMDDLDYKTIF